MKSLVLSVLWVVALVSCDRPKSGPTQAVGSSLPEPVVSQPIEIVDAPPEGDAADIVRREVERAAADRRRLLVYVGAHWCEPCERFRRAAKVGLLDTRLPAVRLLAFDLDRDRERLSRAGYTSQFIPLFALPLPTGMASGEQIEGSIKGPRAVDEISPRLQKLLGMPTRN